MHDNIYPRKVAPLLREALADSPVVLVHGPRQCGKTTLAQKVGEPLGYDYLSFGDRLFAVPISALWQGPADGLATSG